MARTKASVGAKVSSGKSSKARCSVAPPSSTGSSSGSGDKAARSHSGGNPVCPRETPKWQRPITNFFVCKDPDGTLSDDDGATAGSSKSRPKRNVIQSDDEDEEPTDNGEDCQNLIQNGEDGQKLIQNGEDGQKPIQNGEDGQKPIHNEEDDQKPSQNGEDTEKPATNGEVEQAESSNSSTNGSVKPTNHVLDETLELEPLNGENSHKIDEYYSKNAKGKGKGKKTKGKENLDVNTGKRNSIKRDLDEVTRDEESPHASKKVKVNV